MKLRNRLRVLPILLLILVLCACNGQNGESNENVQETQNAIEQQGDASVPPVGTDEIQNQEKPIPSDTNVPENSQDLKVVTAFVYDNDTYVVVENIGEQAILNFRVAYINFDNNGFVTTDDADGYETGRKDTANLMPGDKLIAGWYGGSGDYAVATICGVDYADGTTWEMDRVDRWAENIRSGFDIDEQKAKLAELKGVADLALDNEFVTLTDMTISHGNQFSSSLDFHFSVENTSDQGITSLDLFVLEFDENGFPVSVSPYDTYCVNGHKTGGIINLAAGQSSSYTTDLFIFPTTTQIKVVVSHLEFQDGTDWDNPYLYEWIVTNNNSY